MKSELLQELDYFLRKSKADDQTKYLGLYVDGDFKDPNFEFKTITISFKEEMIEPEYIFKYFKNDFFRISLSGIIELHNNKHLMVITNIEYHNGNINIIYCTSPDIMDMITVEL